MGSSGGRWLERPALWMISGWSTCLRDPRGRGPEQAFPSTLSPRMWAVVLHSVQNQGRSLVTVLLGSSLSCLSSDPPGCAPRMSVIDSDNNQRMCRGPWWPCRLIYSTVQPGASARGSCSMASGAPRSSRPVTHTRSQGFKGSAQNRTSLSFTSSKLSRRKFPLWMLGKQQFWNVWSCGYVGAVSRIQGLGDMALRWGSSYFSCTYWCLFIGFEGRKQVPSGPTKQLEEGVNWVLWMVIKMWPGSVTCPGSSPEQKRLVLAPCCPVKTENHLHLWFQSFSFPIKAIKTQQVKWIVIVHFI